jgi:enoyl-CoA hydratase/carnithine racemase
MDCRNILFTVEEGAAALTFNRPEALNTMNSETMAECCAQGFSTDDQKEGMKAFLEKRKPAFTGK